MRPSSEKLNDKLKKINEKKMSSYKEVGPYLFGVWRPSENDLPGAGMPGWMFQSDPEVGNPAKALL